MNRKIIIPAAITCILWSCCCYAQSNARMLTKHETDSMFAETQYPVFRAWQYKDKGGLHYLLLTEKHTLETLKDTITTNIAAFCILKDQAKTFLRWKMNDAITPSDRSIWFWTKYTELKDLDGDGYLDPLIVYGSSPKEADGEHRHLKMLLYYRHRKVAVRAVTGTLDVERSLQYDPAFRNLPPAIQSYMKKLLQRISKEQDFILADKG